MLVAHHRIGCSAGLGELYLTWNSIHLKATSSCIVSSSHNHGLNDSPAPACAPRDYWDAHSIYVVFTTDMNALSLMRGVAGVSGGCGAYPVHGTAPTSRPMPATLPFFSSHSHLPGRAVDQRYFLTLLPLFFFFSLFMSATTLGPYTRALMLLQTVLCSALSALYLSLCQV